MKILANHSLSQFSEALSKRVPTPGGGSAAAATGAMGVSLLIMVARYSTGKSKAVDLKLKKIISNLEKTNRSFIKLIDLDAKAYEMIVKAKKGTAKQKTQAKQAAQKTVKDIARLSYQAVKNAPFLVKRGSVYLIADVEVAVNLLLASFNSARALYKNNL